MARYTVLNGQVLVEGKKLHASGNPVIGAYVQVVAYPSETVLGVTTTDEYGYWKVTFSEAAVLAIPSVQYQVRFVGSGLIRGTPPTGDWEEIQIITSATGPTGPGVVYRGEYDEYTTYYYTATRRDIVKYNGTYYLCSVDGATGVWNASQWSDFGSTFSSVATDILLAQDASITKTLVLGALDGTHGILRTAEADALTYGNGVWLEDTVDGFGRFRVGTTLAGLLTKGILWDGYALTVKAENIEITASGNLWAVAGGFGGTANDPTLHISGDGLYIKDDNDVIRTYFEVTPIGSRDADGWRIPLASVEKITNGAFTSDLSSWTYSGVVYWDSYYHSADLDCTGDPWAAASIYQDISSNIVAGSQCNLSFDYGRRSGGTFSNITLTVSIIQDAVTLNAITLQTTEEGLSHNLSFVPISSNPIRIQFDNENLGDPIGNVAYVDNVSAKSYEYFVDLNQTGLHVFNSPSSYIKIGHGFAEFVGTTGSFDTLTVNKDLKVYGSSTYYGSSIVATPIQVLNVGAALPSWAGIEIDNGANTGKLLVYDSSALKWAWATRTSGTYGQQTGITKGGNLVVTDTNGIVTFTGGNLFFEASGDPYSSYIYNVNSWNGKSRAGGAIRILSDGSTTTRNVALGKIANDKVGADFVPQLTMNDDNSATFAGDVTLSKVSAVFTVGANTGGGAIILNGAAGQARDYAIQSAGVNRWLIRANATAESGSNAGSNLEIRGRSDAGDDLGSYLTITRSTGAATFASNVILSAGNLQVNNNPIYSYTTGTNLWLQDNTAQAEGVGGKIDFYGKYTDAGALVLGGRIKAYKTNSTTGDWDFGLSLMTRLNGSGDVAEALRLNGDKSATFAGAVTMNGTVTITGAANGGVGTYYQQSRGTVASPLNSAEDGDGIYQIFRSYNSGYQDIAYVAGLTDVGGIDRGRLEFWTKPAGGAIAKVFSLASTGAATFASTVTATGFITSSTTSPTLSKRFTGNQSFNYTADNQIRKVLTFTNPDTGYKCGVIAGTITLVFAGMETGNANPVHFARKYELRVRDWYAGGGYVMTAVMESRYEDSFGNPVGNAITMDVDTSTSSSLTLKVKITQNDGAFDSNSQLTVSYDLVSTAVHAGNFITPSFADGSTTTGNPATQSGFYAGTAVKSAIGFRTVNTGSYEIENSGGVSRIFGYLSSGDVWSAFGNGTNYGLTVDASQNVTFVNLIQSNQTVNGEAIAFRGVNTTTGASYYSSIRLGHAVNGGVDRLMLASNNYSGDVHVGNLGNYNLKLFTDGIANTRVTINDAGTIFTGYAAALGLSSRKTISAYWNSYITLGIAARGAHTLLVRVEGSNYEYDSVFSCGSSNSHTSTSDWNNCNLVSFQGYNCSADYVECLIMSDTDSAGYGETFIVLRFNGGHNANTVSVTAIGSNAGNLSLTDVGASAPYSYVIATSAGRKLLWGAQDAYGNSTLPLSVSIGTQAMPGSFGTDNALSIRGGFGWGSSADSTQLHYAQTDWGGVGALLFGAYKKSASGGANTFLFTTGNTAFAQDSVYPPSNAAGAIEYNRNANMFVFHNSTNSTPTEGQDVIWQTLFELDASYASFYKTVYIKGDTPVLSLKDTNHAYTETAHVSYVVGLDSNDAQVWYVGDGGSAKQVTLWGAAGYAINFYPNGVLALTLDTSGDVTTAGHVIGTTGKSIYNTYTSGQLGGGYKLDFNSSVTSRSYLEVDELRVRGGLRAHIFQKDVVRAINGYVYIGAGATTATASFVVPAIGNTVVVAVKEAYLQAGDIIWVKDIFENSGSLTVYSSYFKVTAGGGTTSVTLTTLSGDVGFTIKSDATLTVVGNDGSTTGRSGGLYMAAADVGSPFLDIYANRTSQAVVEPNTRLGSLSGKTSSIFGVLSGYGLWSQNMYLEGNANIAGTLTAGDANGIGATFYAGLIKKNLKANSDDASMAVNGWTNNGALNHNEYQTTTKPTGLNGAWQLQHLDGTGDIYLWVGECDVNATSYGMYWKASTTYTVSYWTMTSKSSANLNAKAWDFINDDQLGITYYTLTANVWKRISLTFTTPATHSFRFHLGVYATPYGTDSIYVAGLQVEEGSTATLYQQTNSTIMGTGYGMWAIAGGFGGSIQNPVVSLSSLGLSVRGLGSGSLVDNMTAMPFSGVHIGEFKAAAAESTINGVIMRYASTPETSGMFYYNEEKLCFALRGNGTATIAGWSFTSTQFTSASGGISIYSGSSAGISAGYNSSNGVSLYYTSPSSFGVFGKTADVYVFQLGSTNQIAGWTFDQYSIKKENVGSMSAGIYEDGGGAVFLVTAAATLSANPAARMSFGKEMTSTWEWGAGYGLFAYNSAGTKLVSISAADGSGSFGTGTSNISWNSSGVVSLGSAVSLQWTNIPYGKGMNILEKVGFQVEWPIGVATSITGFAYNGLASENNIDYTDGPRSVKVKAWKATTDGGNSADGGWNGSSFSIDITKSYRYTVLVKRTSGTPTGSIYVGCDTTGKTSNLGSGDSLNTNPYFHIIETEDLTANVWYLFVGYIWPSAHTSTVSYSAIYDCRTGKSLVGGTDYKHMSTATTQMHRAFLYYGTDAATVAYFLNPRVDVVDGNEPSIMDLIGTNVTTIDAYMVASPTIVGGTVNGARVQIDSTGIKVYDATPTQRAQISVDGSGWFAASNKLSWTAAGAAKIAGWDFDDASISKIVTTFGTAAVRIAALPSANSLYGASSWGAGVNFGWDAGNGNSGNLWFGQIPDSYSSGWQYGTERVGIMYAWYDGTKLFEISSATGTGWNGYRASIAGWSFDSTTLWCGGTLNVYKKTDVETTCVLNGSTTPYLAFSKNNVATPTSYTDATGKENVAWMGIDTIPKFIYRKDANSYCAWDGVNFSVIGGTITGGILQTSTYGQRVVIDGQTSKLKFYNSDDEFVGSIYGSTTTTGRLVFDPEADGGGFIFKHAIQFSLSNPGYLISGSTTWSGASWPASELVDITLGIGTSNVAAQATAIRGIVNSEGNVSAIMVGIEGIVSTNGSLVESGSLKIGIKGLAGGISGSTTTEVHGVSGNANYGKLAIGVYGTATNGTSGTWAGYFNNGNVLIRNYLRVGGVADSTTEAYGIKFGSSEDTNLYRSGANALKTDDSLEVGGTIINPQGSNTLAYYHANNGRMSLRTSDCKNGVLSWSSSSLNLGWNIWEDASNWQYGENANAAVFRVASTTFYWCTGTGTGNPTDRMSLDNSGNLICGGNVTANGSPSDERLKAHIRPYVIGLEVLRQFNPVKWLWNEKAPWNVIGQEAVGYIAQQLQYLIPTAVKVGNDGFLALNYHELFPVVTNSILEIDSEVTALKREITTLKERIVVLENNYGSK